MESQDWAAWIAVKMVVQATLRTRSADFQKQRAFILGGNGFDGYKGLAVSVRPVGPAVATGRVPGDAVCCGRERADRGFLHRTNTLDTLGDDEPETPCKLNR